MNMFSMKQLYDSLGSNDRIIAFVYEQNSVDGVIVDESGKIDMKDAFMQKSNGCPLAVGVYQMVNGIDVMANLEFVPTRLNVDINIPNLI